MIIDEITQYILAIVPAVTALVGMIVTIGVGIGTIRKANSQTVDEVKTISSRNKALIEQNTEIQKENLELKKAIVELNRKIEIIDTIKAVNREK